MEGQEIQKENEIKSIDFFDGIKLKFIVIDNMFYIDQKDFFKGLFGSQCYSHINHVSARFSHYLRDGIEFYSLEDVNTRVIEYKLPKAKYLKNVGRYENFVSFCSTGMYGIYKQLILKSELAENPAIEFKTKDLNYLEEEHQTDSTAQNVKEDSKEETFRAIEGKLEQKVLDLKKTIDSKSEEIEETEKKLESKEFLLRHSKTVIEDLVSENKELESKIEQLQEVKELPMITALKSQKTILALSCFAIAIFLPFTIMSLNKYIAIETTHYLQEWAILLLCVGMAFIWDFSILLFSVAKRESMAMMGAAFQFVFVSAKFNFFLSIIEYFGGNGELSQKMLVTTCIVIYTPILVYQLAKLSSK